MIELISLTILVAWLFDGISYTIAYLSSRVSQPCDADPHLSFEGAASRCCSILQHEPSMIKDRRLTLFPLLFIVVEFSNSRLQLAVSFRRCLFSISTPRARQTNASRLALLALIVTFQNLNDDKKELIRRSRCFMQLPSSKPGLRCGSYSSSVIDEDLNLI